MDFVAPVVFKGLFFGGFHAKKSSVEVRETFKFASPVKVLHALKVYCSSFYGCMLWDLAGEGAKKYSIFGTLE